MESKIKEILINELDYSEREASVTALDLVNLDEFLQDALESWLERRESVELTIEGVSTSCLVREKGLTYPGALVAMDWLIKDSAIAKKELI